MTQINLATAASVPLRDVKRVEAGRAGDVRLGRVRALFAAVDGRARLVPSWHGAAADRLLDERHARIVEVVIRLLRSRGWEAHAEVSFSEFGERGSIDVLGVHTEARAVAICEVKSVIGSLEETNRMLDIKERLAPSIVFKRVGWRPSLVGRVLILPRDTSARRVVEAHQATLSAVYPARGLELRAWLREPTSPLRAIWFVSDRPNTTTTSP